MRLSAIVITKNEQQMLPKCLQSLDFVDQIIVVDSQSGDRTVKIAQSYHAEIISVPVGTDYASARNRGLKAAAGDWILYLDADERIPVNLKKEIKNIVKLALPASYKVSRQNIMLGKWLRRGGFWPDRVHRLFHKSSLIKWTGKLHESPTIKGEVKILTSPLRHYTARNITAALKKSLIWSPIEAQLLYQAKAPPVVWWKIIKVFFAKLFDILFRKRGLLDGYRAIIIAYIQALHNASVLVNLWQLQQQ